ncbi:hypothetical protein HJC23_007184 [Cyclotella cryptica]|uniref:Uncharacterized protein n=1 Tax=Cyclotella cryptica TaxID=29204 RepID=A0ABD3QPN4_9STRA|eukprot:CCRYP_003462-RA/>CCRYP_003462-RA protein AED:0.45 eAED:0.45 QI:0/0/0/1/1/1/2/0/139
MDDNSFRVEVEPTRIGSLGVGTFLVLAGGIVYILLCIAGTVMKRPSRLYAMITLIYGSLLIYLTNAKRRSRWATPENVVSDFDSLWLTHILVGTVIVTGCCIGLTALIRFDFLHVIVAHEIDTENDKKRIGYGRSTYLF